MRGSCNRHGACCDQRPTHVYSCMKHSIVAFAVLASAPVHAAPTPLPLGYREASPDQLAGKHHVLDIRSEGSLDAVAVGATIPIHVPAELSGGGHGPFYRVFPGPGTITVHAASDGVAVPPTSVRCARAGTYELGVDVVDADRKHLHDTVDITCVTPTRFSAVADAAGPYLARASTVIVQLAWFGMA